MVAAIHRGLHVVDPKNTSDNFACCQLTAELIITRTFYIVK
jgi:hypothetical protein